jgi:ribose 5-phosphate isomerase B
MDASIYINDPFPEHIPALASVAMNASSRVVLAADHAGFALKESIKQYLTGKGMDTVDVGTFSEEAVDYPAIIRKGAAALLEYDCPGIVFGGSGNGEAIAANKVHGIRCALVYSDDTARLARAHNDANMMSLGARLTKQEDAKRFVDIFLSTEFEGGRHIKRVEDVEGK